MPYLGALFLIFVSIFIFLFWAQSPSVTTETTIVNLPSVMVADKVPDTLKIISYNIAYARGFKNDKGDLRDKETITKNLDKIAQVLRETDAAIVFLQEVDLASRRSHYIDEARFLSLNSGFPYYACVINWQKNYVPYPYLNFLEHYGKMKSTQCILSKFPITNNTQIPLPKRTDRPFFYNAFYLNRKIQVANIVIGNKTLELFNIHLEAFDEKNRQEQARILTKTLNYSDADYKIVAGDFNALPPYATVKKNFKDKPEKPWDDVTNDHTMEIISNSNNLIEAADSRVQEDETFTYPSEAPNRRLDHLFFSKNLKLVSTRTINGNDMSDHLPIYIELSFD